MSQGQPQEATPTSASFDTMIDRQADEFEAAWKAGFQPRIRDFLDRVSPEQRPALARELIPIDAYYQRRAGRDPDPDSYARDIPEARGPDNRLLSDIVGELGQQTTCDPALPQLAGRAVESACPRNIGKYVIIPPPLDHGEGGQAQVFRAFHPALGKEVAIKLSHKPLTGDQEQLLAEGRILAKLDHPNLAKVYDLDVHDGRAFLALEYVHGQNLEQWALHVSPSPRQAAAVVAQAARAVGTAHRRGVIHQDLKPKNILIDEKGQVRVIDFGLARMQDAWVPETSQPSGGTPAFVPPEQARAEVGLVGPRSDVFGLGAVLYFLLTKRAPFAAASASVALELARRGSVDWNALESARAPGRLKAICRRALANNPADRHAGADELARDLTGFLRRRWLVAAAMLLLALLAGWWLWPASNQRIDPEVSVRVWRDEQERSLVNTVPLRDGDNLKLQAVVPAGYHATLFLINGKGELGHVVTVPASKEEHRLSYPEHGVSPLQGPTGTECFVLCLRRSRPAELDELRQLWDDGTWAALPKHSVLRFGPAGVRVLQPSRDLGPPLGQPDPEAEVSNRLNDFRCKLSKHFDGIAGLAFAHHE